VNSEMLLRKFLPILILIALIAMNSGAAHGQTKTYSETRKLLLKLDRGLSNRVLKKLFEESDKRMPDLIQALQDPEEKVNLNSQIVLKSLAAPEGLSAVVDWYSQQREQGKSYSLPMMELLTEKQYLNGNDSDLVKLVLKNFSIFKAGKWGSKGLSAKVIAYNQERKTALIELVEGDTFTTGWHIVIRQEGSQWRLVSDNLVWNT
jgi:hypothetical protein